MFKSFCPLLLTVLLAMTFPVEAFEKGKPSSHRLLSVPNLAKLDVIKE